MDDLKKWWKKFGLGLLNDVMRQIAVQNWFIAFNLPKRSKWAIFKRAILRIKYNTYKSIFGFK